MDDKKIIIEEAARVLIAAALLRGIDRDDLSAACESVIWGNKTGHPVTNLKPQISAQIKNWLSE